METCSRCRQHWAAEGSHLCPDCSRSLERDLRPPPKSYDPFSQPSDNEVPTQYASQDDDVQAEHDPR